MASPADSLAGILQIPGVQELLNSQITQSRQQEPLRVGATQTALGMLPNSSFHGSSVRPDVSAIAPANYKTAAPQDSGSSPLAQALKYLAAAGAGAEGARGGVDLKKAFDWIKSKLGGNSANPYGNTTYSGNYDPFAYNPNDPLTGGIDFPSLPGYGTNPGGMPPVPGVSTSEEFQYPQDYPYGSGGGLSPNLPGAGNYDQGGGGNGPAPNWWEE